MRLKYRLRSICLLLVIYVVTACNHFQIQDPYAFISTGIPNINETRALQVSSADTTGGNNDRLSLQPNQKVTIIDQDGIGFLTRLWFTFDSRDPNYLRNILIKIYYEDAINPAVLCPIGDFFGCAFQYKHWTSEMMGMSSGGFYSYWPMPFRKNLRIEIHNDSAYPLYALYFHANLNLYAESVKMNFPYFHAHWHRATKLPNSESYDVLDIEGEGLFVGMHYNAQGLSGGLRFLEGDEFISVDNELVIKGTGMEDYLNSGWYFRTGEYSSHHHGLILKDDSLARISAYRYHVRDAIPFNNAFKMELEHGHANDSYTDMSSVAFWYQKRMNGVDDTILPKGKRSPYKRPVPSHNLYEFQDILSISSQIDTQIIDASKHGMDWNYLNFVEVSPKVKNSFSLNIKDLEEPYYNVKLYTVGGPQYGELLVNHHKIMNLYKPEITPLEPFRLSNQKVTDGTLSIHFEPRGIDKQFGLDAIYIEPVRKYIPEWYFVGPFDNPRLSDVERFGLDSVYDPETKPFDLDDKFSGINRQSVHWKKIDSESGGYSMSLWKYIDPYEFVICYVHAFVMAPETKTYDLMIGSDDGIKVFINGKQVHRFLDVRIAEPDQARIPVKLERGRNSILLKLENNFGGYAFYARFIDSNEELIYSILQ